MPQAGGKSACSAAFVSFVASFLPRVQLICNQSYLGILLQVTKTNEGDSMVEVTQPRKKAALPLGATALLSRVQASAKPCVAAASFYLAITNAHRIPTGAALLLGMAPSVSSTALRAVQACFSAEGGAAGRLDVVLARSFSSSTAAGRSSGSCRHLFGAAPRAAAIAAARSTATPVSTAARAAAAASPALAAAAAVRSRHLATAATGGWQTLRAAAAGTPARQHQQARGFARFLQFQPRPGGGWGGGGGGWVSDSDAVVKGLIGLNIAGFLMWRVAPGSVSLALSRAAGRSQRPVRLVRA